MTFAEMQELFWQRIDQAGSPSFTTTETDRLLNWAYDIWYIINRKKFDTDEQNTVNMTYLIRPFSFNNKSEITVFGVGADLPDYRDLARMRAVFNFVDCDGVSVQQERNVTPVPLSVVDVNTRDPYNKPNKNYPQYSQTHTGTYRVIKIESDTTPVSVSGSYFKNLQVIDGTNTPNVEFEAQDYVARQVIGLAKVLAKGDLDDYAAVKEAMAESALTIGQ